MEVNRPSDGTDPETFFIYGQDVQYLQVSLRTGGGILALRPALVSCSKSVTCLPVPGHMATALETLVAVMQGHDPRMHVMWINSSGAEPASLGFALPCPGNVVSIDVCGESGALLLAPEAVLCATRDITITRQSRFGARTHHPCARMLRVSSTGAPSVAAAPGLAGAPPAPPAAAAGGDGDGGGGGGGRSGLLFLAGAGVIVQKALRDGEALVVVEGCLLGFSELCTVAAMRRAPQVGGTLNRGRTRLLEIRGPGTVYYQSDHRSLRWHLAAAAGGPDAGWPPDLGRAFHSAVLTLGIVSVIVILFAIYDVLDSMDEPDL